jgi:hypothetical protein
MEAHCHGLPLPKSKQALTESLHQLFEKLTSETLEPGKQFYVSKYDTRDMSAGMISCNFWLEKGFPLLVQRYEQQQP